MIAEVLIQYDPRDLSSFPMQKIMDRYNATYICGHTDHNEGVKEFIYEINAKDFIECSEKISNAGYRVHLLRD